MELDQLKQALLRLNELHQEATRKHVRTGRGQTSERPTGGGGGRLDSPQALLEEVHREIAAFEEQVPAWNILRFEAYTAHVQIW